MLLIATSWEKLLIAQDTLIFSFETFTGFILRSKVALRTTSTFHFYTRFSEYDLQSSKREDGKVKTSIEKDSKEATANGQVTKKIIRSVILHSSSSSSNASSVLGFTVPFQIFSINGVDSTKTDKGGTILVNAKPQFVQW